LQLLLIIDTICDWARDTYRLDILRCLSGGNIDPRAFTPASSIANSQRRERARSDICSSDSTSGSSTPPNATPPALDSSNGATDEEIRHDLDSVMLDADSLREEEEEREAQTRPSTFAKNDNHLLRYDNRHSDAPAWTRNATIQHSNFVRFVYRYYSVPEDLETLALFLSSVDEADELAVSATKILTLFQDPSAFDSILDEVLALERLWTGICETSMLPNSRDLVRTRISFRTFFDAENWQMVRILECFTCSQEAEHTLNAIAGWAYENSALHDHGAHDLRSLIEPLRSLHGRKSMIAAVLNLDLQLFVTRPEDSNTQETCWNRCEGSVIRSMFEKLDDTNLDELLQLHVRYQAKECEIRPTASTASWLDSILDTKDIKGHCGAILLRKPLTWSECCPTFCLVVFDPIIDFENGPSLGRRLNQVVHAKDKYGVAGGVRRSRKRDEVDRKALELWSSILQGDAPPDTPWPTLL
jgi:hypothetical protein